MATYFKGRKPDPGPDPTKNISYYNNYKEVSGKLTGTLNPFPTKNEYEYEYE